MILLRHLEVYLWKWEKGLNSYELQMWKAEHLDTVEKNIELNRTQRNIRNIITEGRKTDEIHTFILQKIEKELSMNR